MVPLILAAIAAAELLWAIRPRKGLRRRKHSTPIADAAGVAGAIVVIIVLLLANGVIR